MNPFNSVYNFYNNVLALKTKYFLLTALAIHLCIGKNLKKFRYIAIVIMLYATFLAYQLNKIYGYLWLILVVLFIYLNDIVGIEGLKKKLSFGSEYEITDLYVGSPSEGSEGSEGASGSPAIE
jgi:hypothetical protein